MAGVHREAIQKQIHQDWANREYIEVITTSIKRITDFLNSFGEFSFFVVCSSVIHFIDCLLLHSNWFSVPNGETCLQLVCI